MPPETDPTQFPRQIWQTVTEFARTCLVENDFCVEQSRIENLRCVHFESEKECMYGLQVWYFEAIGVDANGRRHMRYGALSFSVEYGLLESNRTAVFEEASQRKSVYALNSHACPPSVWDQTVTRFWVRTTCLGVLVGGLIWCVGAISLFRAERPSPKPPLHSLTQTTP
jgi:hypothetical protein